MGAGGLDLDKLEDIEKAMSMVRAAENVVLNRIVDLLAEKKRLEIEAGRAEREAKKEARSKEIERAPGEVVATE